MEDTNVALWESEEAFDQFPAQLIPCPLEGDAFIENYSLKLVAEELGVDLDGWEEEMEAQRAAPSLSQKRERGNQNPMKPLSHATKETRQKTQEEFVGFCVRWLDQEPSLALVMKPQLVAKFLGYLQAKPNAGSHKSLIRYCNQLSPTVDFVVGNGWPGDDVWTDEHVKKVKDWYANLRGQCTLAIQANTTISPIKISLWQGWEHAKTHWDGFMTAFQVSDGHIA